MLVLLVGDLHIPHRATAIPAKFRELLATKSLSAVICTGNAVTKGQLDFFRTIATDVHFVKGDFDEFTAAEEKLESFRVGVIHGHQVVPWGDRDALATHARRVRLLSALSLLNQLGVDLLVCGHTHKFASWTHEGCLFVNPGSLTGVRPLSVRTRTQAFSPVTPDVRPEFALLDIQGTQV